MILKSVKNAPLSLSLPHSMDYSHGVSLDFSDSSVTSDSINQGVVVHMPWTTGFGVGYRIKE